MNKLIEYNKKIVFLTILLLTISNFVFAFTKTEMFTYLHEIVIVYYYEKNVLEVEVGKVLDIVNDKNDYTFDNLYSYIIMLTKDNKFKAIKIKDILNIKIVYDNGSLN